MPVELMAPSRHRRAVVDETTTSGLGRQAWGLVLIHLALIGGIALLGTHYAPAHNKNIYEGHSAYIPDTDQVLSMLAPTRP